MTVFLISVELNVLLTPFRQKDDSRYLSKSMDIRVADYRDNMAKQTQINQRSSMAI